MSRGGGESSLAFFLTLLDFETRKKKLNNGHTNSVTRPTRSRSLSAGSQLRGRWSASVLAAAPAPSRGSKGQQRRTFCEEEGDGEDEEGDYFSSSLDADAALDALEADARAWGKGSNDDGDRDLSASLLMLPRELLRSLLV